MSKGELDEWAKYFEHEPSNSVEIQLAQLSYITSVVNGNKSSKFNDFLITAYKDKKPNEPQFKDAASIKSIFSAVAIAK